MVPIKEQLDLRVIELMRIMLEKLPKTLSLHGDLVSSARKQCNVSVRRTLTALLPPTFRISVRMLDIFS